MEDEPEVTAAGARLTVVSFRYVNDQTRFMQLGTRLPRRRRAEDDYYAYIVIDFRATNTKNGYERNKRVETIKGPFNYTVIVL